MNALIAAAKQSATDGMEMFLRNFAHIPDDRLNWAPVPTAKTPLRVAAHTALYAGRFAKMINDRNLPAFDNLEEWLASRDAEEVAVTSREEMESAFRAGTAEVLLALDNFPEELIGTVIDTRMGWKMPVNWLVALPGWHATLHTGQIDYLQTCWDDQEVYLA